MRPSRAACRRGRTFSSRPTTTSTTPPTAAGGELDDQTVPYSWYGVSFEGLSLYAFPGKVEAHTDPIAYKYSKTAPANVWQWVSYPLQVSKNESITIKEIVLRFQGAGTLTVTVTRVDATTGATLPANHTFTTTAQAAMYRFDAGTDGLRAQDITITIAAEGTSGERPRSCTRWASATCQGTKPLNAT